MLRVDQLELQRLVLAMLYRLDALQRRDIACSLPPSTRREPKLVGGSPERADGPEHRPSLRHDLEVCCFERALVQALLAEAARKPLRRLATHQKLASEDVERVD
eukprot:3938864-Rhodomonas_salina.2